MFAARHGLGFATPTGGNLTASLLFFSLLGFQRCRREGCRFDAIHPISFDAPNNNRGGYVAAAANRLWIRVHDRRVVPAALAELRYKISGGHSVVRIHGDIAAPRAADDLIPVDLLDCAGKLREGVIGNEKGIVARGRRAASGGVRVAVKFTKRKIGCRRPADGTYVLLRQRLDLGQVAEGIPSRPCRRSKGGEHLAIQSFLLGVSG